MTNETYPMPEHGWTCFHCGETLTTPGAAREHFGRTPDRKPGCVLKVELGGERGLLMALRGAEDELARYREEDGDLQRSLATMQSRHAPALMAAEEAGYARGLRDAGYGGSEQARKERLAFAEKCFIAGCEHAGETVTYEYAQRRWEDSCFKMDLETECLLPPRGWKCTRKAGHEGPCAAVLCEGGGE